MRTRCLPFAILLLTLDWNYSQAQIYVNDDATGANTGYNWTDAFNDLQDALAIAEPGDQIWVAEGIYKPDTINGGQSSSFVIDKNLQLYGGFVGTETSLAQRPDPADHPSVLSGDLNGNDLDGNPTANKLDNVLHVVRVNTNVTNETLMDGFTIRNGYADGSGNLSDGGGMICSGKPVIRQCIFKLNGALGNGGAVRLNSISTPGIVFEDCQFNQNRANVGGGMNIQSSYFTITGCSFSDNAAVTGAFQDNGGGIFSTNSYGVVQDCSFTGNSALEYGGGMLAWTSQGFNGGSIEVRGCHFENNTANITGGGLNLTSFGTNAQFSVVNCEFIENSATFQGAGFEWSVNASSSSNATLKVDSCYFSGNTSQGSSGAGIFMGGSNTTFELTNSVFENNNTTAWYATAAVYSGGTGSALVDNCVFQNNNSVHSAGLDIGGGGDFDHIITNCDFLQNHADSVNAGFDIWADVGSSLNFTIENCLIDGNTAGERAAGFWVIPASDDFHATMKNCRIVNNQSPKGAAIDIFREAVAGFPALENASFTIENCLIANNTSDSGVIALDTLRHFNLLNCTIADNQGGGILNGNLGGITLQNTILHNPGFTEYVAATENATFTSLGGNLVSDGSLAGLLVTGSDKQGLDPLLSADFHLLEGSPCVDAGNPDGVTASEDLDGNDRIQGGRVDMGAFESPFVSSAREVLAGEVAVSPNPVSSFLNIQLPENNVRQLDVQVFDAQGRLVLLANGQVLDVQGLAAGMYSLKVVVGERVFTGKFVRQ